MIGTILTGRWVPWICIPAIARIAVDIDEEVFSAHPHSAVLLHAVEGLIRRDIVRRPQEVGGKVGE